MDQNMKDIGKFYKQNGNGKEIWVDGSMNEIIKWKKINNIIMINKGLEIQSTKATLNGIIQLLIIEYTIKIFEQKNKYYIFLR